jgi:hypothetical protein
VAESTYIVVGALPMVFTVLVACFLVWEGDILRITGTPYGLALSFSRLLETVSRLWFTCAVIVWLPVGVEYVNTDRPGGGPISS